jgi:hypothetical protein
VAPAIPAALLLVAAAIPTTLLQGVTTGVLGDTNLGERSNDCAHVRNLSFEQSRRRSPDVIS